MNLKKPLILFMLLISSLAQATPDTLNFQARIRKNDGTVLEATDVSFFFRYTSADGSCVLFEEAYDNQNMYGSGGLVNFQLGIGVDNPALKYRVIYSAGATLKETFRSSGNFTCKGGSPYTPGPTEIRKLTVMFQYPGSGGWNEIAGIKINAVPYAMHASESDSSKNFIGSLLGDITGTQSATVVSGIRGAPVSATAPTTGQVLQFNGTQYVPTSIAAGGVTNVSSPNADIGVATGSTTPVLTLNSGTTGGAGDANKIAKLDGGGKIPAAMLPSGLITSDTLTGDVGGTFGATVLANSGATAGTYTKVTVDAKGRVTSGADISASDITTALTYTPVNPTALSNYLTMTAYATDVADVATCTGTQKPFWSSGNDKWECANIQVASTSQAGLVSSTDWNTFNNKVSSQWMNGAAGAIYYNGGDVGLGINTPAAPFHIARAVVPGGGATMILDRTTSSHQAYLAFTTSATTDAYIGVGANGRLDLGTGVGTNVISILGNNAGIGTTNPNEKLQVVDGNISLKTSATTTPVMKWQATDNSERFSISGVTETAGLTTDEWKFSNTFGFTSFNNLNIETMRLTSNNRVGLGVAVPTEKLDVAGNINITGNYMVNGVAIGGGSGTVTNVTSPNADIGITAGTTAPVLTLNSGATGGAGDANKIAKLDAGGKIPAAMLPSGTITSDTLTGDVGGTLGATVLANSGVTTGTYTKVTVDAKGRVTSGTDLSASDVTTALTYTPVNPTTLASYLTTAAYGADVADVASCSGVQKPYWSSGLDKWECGNIQVASTSQAGLVSSTDWNTFNNKVSSQWVNGAASSVYYNGGNVGIGMADPNFKMQFGQASGFGQTQIHLQNQNSGGVDNGVRISNGMGQSTYSAIELGFNNLTSGDASYVAFRTAVGLSSIVQTSNTDLGTERMRIDNTGNVGINTSAPNEKLHVVGNVNITGSYMVNGVPIGSGSIGGSGTTNRISKFTAAGAIGDSNINDDGTVVSTATDMIVHGLTIGRGTASEYRNTAVGSSVLLSNTTGNKNSGLGYDALRNNTSGTANTGIGFESLKANNIGARNSALGSTALTSNTTGSNNTAVGADSLSTLTTGASNVAVGSNALSVNNGSGNTSVGFEANKYSTGSYNAAFGFNALQNSTANNNSAFGAYAMEQNTSGQRNASFGYGSLYYNTTGERNAGLGYQVLNSNSTGNRNTALGYSALSGNDTGSQNIAIGHESGMAITTGSNNVVIGSNDGSTIATSSNNMIFSDGAGNIRQQIDSSGLVGLGMAPSTYRLSVSGDVNVTGTFRVNGTPISTGSGTVTGVSSANTDIGVADGNVAPILTLNSGATGGAGDANKIAKLDAGGRIPAAMLPSGTAMSSDLTNYLSTAAYGVDVADVTSCTGVQKPYWSSGNDKWECGNIQVASTSQAGLISSTDWNAFNGKMSGTGTTNAVPKFTAGSTIGDSHISDNGTVVAISTDATVNGVNIGRGGTNRPTNTAVGASALSANTSGVGNSAVGSTALQTNTTGSFNTATGQNALAANNGDRNVAFGGYALGLNTSGAENSAVGHGALYNNLNGYANSAFGYQALNSNSTGGSNLALGHHALFSNETASLNTAVGMDALALNVSGSGNVAVGYQALLNNTAGGNVAIGYRAGNAITTGASNVVIGGNDGSTIATLNNRMIFADGAGNIRANVNNSGQWGFGVASPGYTVDVNGDVNVSGVFRVNGTPISSGSGTVTSVSSANTDIGVSMASPTPILTLNSGTTGGAGDANKIAKLDAGGRLPAAMLPASAITSNALTGDVSGTFGATSVDKIKAVDVTITTLTSGNFLKYNGAAWVNSNISTADVSGLSTNYVQYSQMPASCAANQTLHYSTPSGAWVCYDIDSLDGAKITTGTVDAARLPASVKYWVSATGGINYASGNVGLGTGTPEAKMDVNGTTSTAASLEGVTTYTNTTAAYVIPDTSVNARRLTLNANTTITLPAFTTAATRIYTLTLFLKQDGTGNKTVTWAGGGSTIKWDSGTAPTISLTADKITIIQLIKASDESIWYGSQVWKEN